jgi:S1-C subfamily serine protease
VKVQAIRNYAEDTRRGAIVVKRPLTASETISVSEPAPCAPGNAARHSGVIVYDAASGEGSSGAPVFGQSGRVIGIHFGYFDQNRLSNYAVPIGHGLALLRQAGWKPVD